MWCGAAPKNGSGCASNHAPHLTTDGRAAPDHDDVELMWSSPAHRKRRRYYDHGSNAHQTSRR